MGKHGTEEERSFLLLSGTPSVAYANQPPGGRVWKKISSILGEKGVEGNGLKGPRNRTSPLSPTSTGSSHLGGQVWKWSLGRGFWSGILGFWGA